jgi:hypothetical protein
MKRKAIDMTEKAKTARIKAALEEYEQIAHPPH